MPQFDLTVNKACAAFLPLIHSKITQVSRYKSDSQLAFDRKCRIIIAVPTSHHVMEALPQVGESQIINASVLRLKIGRAHV